jgi:hypothetical protein
MFRSTNELGRAVTSSEEAKLCRNKERPASVFTRHGTNEISVDRFGSAEINEYVDSGISVARSRGAFRRFHGWLVLTDQAIVGLGLTSQAACLPDNPHHVNIVLPADAATDDNVHDRWAARLARNSDWEPRP